MKENLLTESDVKQLESLGISPEAVEGQIETFQRGFKATRLVRPATVGDGILGLSGEESARLSSTWSEIPRGRAMKFVPASGAASRMFKMLLSFKSEGPLRRDEIERRAAQKDGEYSDLLRFMDGIRKFAFFEDLETVMARHGIDADEKIRHGHFEEILGFLLNPEGLGAASLPKGLIPFHRYKDGNRTPFEEQLVDAIHTVRDGEGRVRVHFTVPEEHREAIRMHLESVRKKHEKAGTEFLLDLSVQKHSTDTVAVDMGNRPFRDKQGKLVFRPGGHGALLENLNDLHGDIVFIKNIDNVVPYELKGPVIQYKRVLGGLLVRTEKAVHAYARELQRGIPGDALLAEIESFVIDTLGHRPPPSLDRDSRQARHGFLLSSLNRPIRVCGMVRNQGEPGGGPFWVQGEDGALSLQIVESSQVNMGLEEQEQIWKSSTHFNPVDLACSLRDFEGKPFHLPDYRDPDTVFISRKSKDGRELKALELPGLWNGGMAYWTTLFVEVPIETFNPVKTVLDLLRSQHQPG